MMPLEDYAKMCKCYFMLDLILVMIACFYSKVTVPVAVMRSIGDILFEEGPSLDDNKAVHTNMGNYLEDNQWVVCAYAHVSGAFAHVLPGAKPIVYQHNDGSASAMKIKLKDAFKGGTTHTIRLSFCVCHCCIWLQNLFASSPLSLRQKLEKAAGLKTT